MFSVSAFSVRIRDHQPTLRRRGNSSDHVPDEWAAIRSWSGRSGGSGTATAFGERLLHRVDGLGDEPGILRIRGGLLAERSL